MEKGFAMKKPVRYVRLDTPAEVCDVFAEYGREVRMKKVPSDRTIGPDEIRENVWMVARSVGGISNLEYVPLPVYMVAAGEAMVDILTQREFERKFDTEEKVRGMTAEEFEEYRKSLFRGRP